jgi:hypothetical protein
MLMPFGSTLGMMRHPFFIDCLSDLKREIFTLPNEEIAQRVCLLVQIS